MGYDPDFVTAIPYTPEYYAQLWNKKGKPGIRRCEQDIAAVDTQFEEAGYIHDMLPGILYLSSPDAFVEWEITTTEDQVDTTRYYQTGPASWQAVPIWGFRAKIKRRTWRFITAGDGYRVNQDNGVAIIGANPAPKWRWWFEIGRTTTVLTEHVNIRGTDETDDQITGGEGGQQLAQMTSANVVTGAPGGLIGVLFPIRLTRFITVAAFGAGPSPSVAAVLFGFPQNALNDGLEQLGEIPFPIQAAIPVGPAGAIGFNNFEFTIVDWSAVWSTKL